MIRAFFVIVLCFVAKVYAETEVPSSIYQIMARSMEGQNMPFSAFRGRVLLIVNTASKDKNSSQMIQLQDLYQKYSEKGFIVLGFPSDDFLNEEPGTNSQVWAAYQQKFHVTFPIFEKCHVTGPDISPVFAYLTSPKYDPNFAWEIDWSFTKFLVDRSGKVVGRFSTTTKPDDEKLTKAIEKALAE